MKMFETKELEDKDLFVEHERAITAMFDNSFPVNPIPFALTLAKMCKTGGTDIIQTDEARMVLWTLMAQSYGQLTTVGLYEEWSRLHERYQTITKSQGV
jgi:hypothetical protein